MFDGSQGKMLYYASINSILPWDPGILNCIYYVFCTNHVLCIQYYIETLKDMQEKRKTGPF